MTEEDLAVDLGAELIQCRDCTAVRHESVPSCFCGCCAYDPLDSAEVVSIGEQLSLEAAA